MNIKRAKIIPVMFRVDKNGPWRGKVTAVFPTMPFSADPDSFVVYDMESGHSSGRMEWFRTTRTAQFDEYELLLRHLRDVYYDATLEVRSKMHQAYRVTRQERIRSHDKAT